MKPQSETETSVGSSAGLPAPTSPSRILVVEDEGIVAMDIATTLRKLGYDVVGTTGTGEESVRIAIAKTPDLILMDIHLAGDMDGIAAAEAIQEQKDIPIVYLTAYTDEETIQRAKHTAPYGYAVKPYEERELRSALEIALHKHHMERRVRESEGRLDATLRSITDAVVTIDEGARITFLNRQAALLLGAGPDGLLGRDVRPTVQIMGDQGRPVPLRFEEGGTTVQGTITTLVGREVPVEGRIAPIRTAKERLGWVLVLRDMTEHRVAEAALRELASIVTSTEAGILSVDLHGEVRAGNESCERLLGRSRSEIMGAPVASLFPDTDWVHALHTALEEGGSWSSTWEKVPAPDGTTRRLGIHVAPRHDPGGSFIGSSIILHDLPDEEDDKGLRSVRRRLIDRARQLI